MVEPQPALAGGARTVWVEVDLAEAVAGEGERRRGDEAGEDELLDPGGAVEPGVEPARSWCSDDTVGLSLMLACRRRGGTSEQSSERGAPLGSHRESRMGSPLHFRAGCRMVESQSDRAKAGSATERRGIYGRGKKHERERVEGGRGGGERVSSVTREGGFKACSSIVHVEALFPPGRSCPGARAREDGGGAATRGAGPARSRRRSLLRRQPAPPVKVFSSAIEL